MVPALASRTIARFRLLGGEKNRSKNPADRARCCALQEVRVEYQLQLGDPWFKSACPFRY